MTARSPKRIVLLLSRSAIFSEEDRLNLRPYTDKRNKEQHTTKKRHWNLHPDNRSVKCFFFPFSMYTRVLDWFVRAARSCNGQAWLNALASKERRKRVRRWEVKCYVPFKAVANLSAVPSFERWTLWSWLNFSQWVGKRAVCSLNTNDNVFDMETLLSLVPTLLHSRLTRLVIARWNGTIESA